MSEPSSPPRRPRLSLQIKAISNGSSGRTSRALAATVDPKSPTAFNTLSNVYVTAIDRTSTPVQQEPVTAISTRPPALQIQTALPAHAPYTGPYLDTPLTAQPISPAMAQEIKFPSSMTATPPLSAGPMTPNGAKPFSFQIGDSSYLAASQPPPQSPRTPRRRTTAPAHSTLKPPYTHPRALHSILRNSPLPPLNTKSPISPRRQSLRLQEKAAKKVAYNSPLEQTIITNTYTRSHVDLLYDDASPFSPANPSEDPELVLDSTMAYTGDETRDGGQTPGPFEEMRRRMAGLGTSSPALSPISGGVRKRKQKKEKKRRWVWTIGQEEEEEGSPVMTRSAEVPAPKPPAAVPVIALPVPKGKSRGPAAPGVPMLQMPIPRLHITAAPADAALDITPIAHVSHELPVMNMTSFEPPTPSVESSASQDSLFEDTADVEMSDTSSFLSDVEDRLHIAQEMDIDMTPTVCSKPLPGTREPQRLGSTEPVNPETGSRRDTPIPPDLMPDN